MSDNQLVTWLAPFPPTVNTYWRHVMTNGRRQTLISKKGREYRDAFKREWYMARPKGWAVIRNPVSVQVCLYPPDNRRRDLDNYLKAMFDGASKAGVWEDDSLVHHMTVYWGTPGDKQSGAMIRIFPMEAIINAT